MPTAASIWAPSSTSARGLGRGPPGSNNVPNRNSGRAANEYRSGCRSGARASACSGSPSCSRAALRSEWATTSRGPCSLLASTARSIPMGSFPRLNESDGTGSGSCPRTGPRRPQRRTRPAIRTRDSSTSGGWIRNALVASTPWEPGAIHLRGSERQLGHRQDRERLGRRVLRLARSVHCLGGRARPGGCPGRRRPAISGPASEGCLRERKGSAASGKGREG
jgi:hypothetical protein